MRADMAKVIVERPRVGSRLPSRKKGYRKYVQKTGVENLPIREPMLGHWRGERKSLNEHLGPMRRFLRSNIGRPWNKVHQELCEHVSFDNPVQSHVLTHVFDFVKQHVEFRGLDIFESQGWRRMRALPAGTMYICPKTGLLRVVRKKVRRSQKTRVGLGRLLQFHCVGGVWWELRLQPLTRREFANKMLAYRPHTHRPLPTRKLIFRRHSARRPDVADRMNWDVWLERWVSSDDDAELTSIYGNRLYAISKRILNSTETRDLYRKLRTSRKE